jgi:HPt (histidine-containing phosphotransfer) domain-containing protein
MPAASSSSKPVVKGKGCPSRNRPIDLVHLSRQTLGDQGLEQEVLGLMDRQITAFTGRLGLATEDERRHIAHALKGAARNIGAFALADAAETVEHAPRDAEALAAFGVEMARTAAFIATLRN